MDVTIRKSEREDCLRMMELVQELAVYEREPDAVNVAFDHFVESGFGDKPVWWAFVAEINGVVEGFALYYTRYSTWKGQRMYLEDLLVTEKLRGMGVGKLLFDKLVEEAREQKFSGVAWQVLEWNEPAINFYKKLGNVSFDNGWVNCSVELT